MCSEARLPEGALVCEDQIHKLHVLTALKKFLLLTLLALEELGLFRLWYKGVTPGLRA
jgi:hypothetical protein